MKRKLFFALALSGILSEVFVSCSSQSKKEAEKITVPAIPATNDLPNMILTGLNGESVIARKLEGKNVLILFQPDCDHCQRESKQIKDHLASFKGYTLYFISADLPQNIKKFSDDYQLSGIENVHFFWTASQGIYNNFGAISAPSVYVYKNGALKAKFNGETDINLILKSL